MRYIDADALIDNLNRFAPEHFNALINQLILKQPTADVKPVVRGEWLYLGLDVAGDYMYQCSQCKAIIYEPEFLINYDKAQLLGNRFNYCPNCGSKMKGGDAK